MDDESIDDDSLPEHDELLDDQWDDEDYDDEEDYEYEYEDESERPTFFANQFSPRSRSIILAIVAVWMLLVIFGSVTGIQKLDVVSALNSILLTNCILAPYFLIFLPVAILIARWPFIFGVIASTAAVALSMVAAYVLLWLTLGFYIDWWMVVKITIAAPIIHAGVNLFIRAIKVK